MNKRRRIYKKRKNKYKKHLIVNCLFDLVDEFLSLILDENLNKLTNYMPIRIYKTICEGKDLRI